MKSLSVKVKITLWYLLVMVMVSASALGIMTAVSRNVIESDVKGRITKCVSDFGRRLETPDGKIGMIPRHGFYEQGVHMQIYDGSGNLLSGNSPFELQDTAELKDDDLRKISKDEDIYYIYTKSFTFRSGETIYVKGVMSLSDESFAVTSAAKTNLIITVLLLCVAAAGGYFIVSRVLAPVSRISKTARSIAESNDLSQRISIGKGSDEIHELANTFDNMIERIEQTLEREKQFTSDASHELRTPVAVIISECEYMLDCSISEEEQKESVLSVKNQAEKMSKLISELLTITRMDKNSVKTVFEAVDISELLGFVCDEQEEIHDGSIALHREICGEVCAEADRSLLARLFINIISNAYTYGKKDGNIWVSLKEEKEKIVFSVADDGIGIAPENLDKIWERFYQVDSARTSNEEGNTGLGLSMTKWIAERHGGKISVSSKLGEGSVFRFEMLRKQRNIF